MGQSLWTTVKPLGSFSFALAINPIINEGKGITVLEFCFSMLFFNTWMICPQISISLWVKRSYRNLVLGADSVVRLVTGYKL